MCKQISSNPYENEMTYKLFTYKSHMYICLKVGKQITDDKLLLLHNNTWNHLDLCKQMIDSVGVNVKEFMLFMVPDYLTLILIFRISFSIKCFPTILCWSFRYSVLFRIKVE